MKLRIFCYLHFFPPVHNAGSETTVHAAMRALVERGHEVVVLADQTPESYEIDGIQVLSPPKRPYIHDWIIEQARGYDLLITHLDCSGRAMNLSIDSDLPLVHFVHNHMQVEFHSIAPNKSQLMVFNSHSVANAQKYKGMPWPARSIVMHPIVEPERYRCERGTMITFCNPTDGKGVATVHKIAEAMPDRQFLIVEGHYGEQVAPPHLSDEWVAAHPNIRHIKNDPEFRNVLRQTKVLLMPSNYESYGRCAVEAACAGIPSIVHPTDGLKEALGDAGNYCDRADVSAWVAEINRLLTDDVYYRSRSNACLKFAESLNPEAEFDRLEKELIKTVAEWKASKEVKIVAMWISDRRIYELSDGRLMAEVDGRMPANAIRLAAGIGTELPEEVARAHGFLPPLEVKEEVKAVEAPEENKAITAPPENKATKGRKKKVA